MEWSHLLELERVERPTRLIARDHRTLPPNQTVARGSMRTGGKRRQDHPCHRHTNPYKNKNRSNDHRIVSTHATVTPINASRKTGPLPAESTRLTNIRTLHTKIAVWSRCKRIPAIRLGKKINAVKPDTTKLSCDPARVMIANVPITMVTTESMVTAAMRF